MTARYQRRFAVSITIESSDPAIHALKAAIDLATVIYDGQLRYFAHLDPLLAGEYPYGLTMAAADTLRSQAAGEVARAELPGKQRLPFESMHYPLTIDDNTFIKQTGSEWTVSIDLFGHIKTLRAEEGMAFHASLASLYSRGKPTSGILVHHESSVKMVFSCEAKKPINPQSQLIIVQAKSMGSVRIVVTSNRQATLKRMRKECPDGKIELLFVGDRNEASLKQKLSLKAQFSDHHSHDDWYHAPAIIAWIREQNATKK